jgi:lipopolysaccharide export system permease protein
MRILILDRYIVRECLKLIGLALTLFMGVYVIVDLFEKFPRFLGAHVRPDLVLRYYALSLPTIFIQVLPVAVLLACLLTLGNMARYNEVLAMKMGQVGSLRIALPCLALGLAASGCAWVASEHLAPTMSERALNIWRAQVQRIPAYSTTKNSDIWYRAQDNRFVYISLLEAQSGTIRGMSIFELSPSFALLRRYDAQRAAWNGDGWHLYDGYRVSFSGEQMDIAPFSETAVPLSEKVADFARVARSPEEMTYAQLRQYIERLESSGVKATRYRVDLQAKVAIALVSLIMAVLGVSFGLRTGKAGVMIWVGACITLGFVYWVLLSLGIQLGRGGALPPLLAAWLPNAVFALAGLASLWRVRG